jgi:hypothetical protein
VAEARLAVAAEDHMGEAGRTVAQAGAATVRAIHRTSNRSLALPRSSAPSPWPTIAASATPTRLWSRTVVMAAAYARGAAGNRYAGRQALHSLVSWPTRIVAMSPLLPPGGWRPTPPDRGPPSVAGAGSRLRPYSPASRLPAFIEERRAKDAAGAP